MSGTAEQRLQIDASTNPGNSGGPVVDKTGRLIGIVSAIMTLGGGFDGTGLAVSIDDIDHMLMKYAGIFDFLGA